MRVAARYSFNGGDEYVNSHFQNELFEVCDVVHSINAMSHKSKKSKEKAMSGRMLFSPGSINKLFKKEFFDRNWVTKRIDCTYTQNHYVDGYDAPPLKKGAFREMDYLKNRLGVEVQLGKYAFMAYNVCAKMTIFHNHDLIDAGVEIVPVKELAEEMSTGVSYFEQIVWDLDARGVSNIDIPVLVFGIAP